MRINAINQMPISKYRNTKLKQERQDNTDISINSNNINFKGLKASIFFGTVGAIVAGPVGALVGSLVGSAVNYPPEEDGGGGGGGAGSSSSDEVKY